MQNNQNFDFNELMTKAKEMQGKMQEMQGKIANMTVVGKAGGGLVEITKRGNQYAVKTVISTDLVPGLSTQDREMIEDLVTAAINDAVDKIEAATKEQLSGFVGMKLPEGFGGEGDAGSSGAE
ncbi:MAG: YbaB/EbfC family nucleoid-associated protein [Gammaproteobacteria bacterium]|nr:YbaB/EbfC family nucleoid-associated protein [Gammaproteobacteria bacterium]